MQHTIRRLEGIAKADLAAQHFHQLVVGYHDQGINMLRQRLNAFHCHFHALAFKTERFGHHSHGQDTQLLGYFGYHRCGAGACAAPHAGGDEQHVGAVDQLGDALSILQRRFAPDCGVGARAQPLGDGRAQLHGGTSLIALERLRIGVGADKFDAAQATGDHVIHCIAAAAAHADHLDYRFLCLCVHDLKHACLLNVVNPKV